MAEKKRLNAPLIIIVVYLITTLILYAIGPFRWITYSPIVFWSLNIVYIVALIIGWNCGATRYCFEYHFADDDAKKIISKLRFLITINFVYEIIIALRRFNITSFNIILLLKKIIKGFSDIGGSYSDFQSGIDDINTIALGGKAVSCFNLIWAFLGFNIILLGIIYFKKLSFYNKMILIATIVLIIVEYVATGTNIGVFRIILVFLVFFFIRVAREKTNDNERTNRNNNWRIIILSVLSVIIVLLLFDKIMQSRGGILLWESRTFNVGGVHLNPDSVLFIFLPKGLYMLFIALSSYLCQGYYGMSLSLRIPWMPGFGVGHSMALLNMLGDTFQLPHNNTYQFRVSQFGWKEGVQWHTMYSWFANDVTYIGVIFVMLIIGMLFAMAYKDAVRTNNPYAKMVTYYMSLLAFFIPCNNQLFQSTYIMFAFITALVLWFFSRGRKRVVITIGRGML